MKTTSKQADATLLRLTNAMQRNTSLATGKGSDPAPGPVATYTPQPPPSASRTPAARRSASGIRLKPEDNAKIREILQAGLMLQETLTGSDAIRLALRAYDPKRLSSADIAQLHARDGRSNPSGQRLAASH